MVFKLAGADFCLYKNFNLYYRQIRKRVRITSYNVCYTKLLRPAFLGEKQTQQHESYYWEFHENNGRQAALKGDWKLVLYNVMKPAKKEVMLFNLASDPYETTNLAKQHPEKVAELMQIINDSRVPVQSFPFVETLRITSYNVCYTKLLRAIIDRARHLVLESVHPSPLSAARGFFGNHHFSLTNQYLTKHQKSPIIW